MIIAAALFALAGCEQEESQDSLTVNPSTLDFAAGETTGKTVAVATNALEWSANSDAAWITLAQEGAVLTVTLNEPHIGTEARKDSITVTAGNAKPEIIAVIQQATQSLTVTPLSLNFAANETGGKTVAVTTNASKWTADADVTWITLTQEGAALTVAVNGAHLGTEPRKGSITVTAGNAESAIIAVTQQATQSLTVNPSSLNFAAGETGSKSVTVTTNAVDGWKASYSAEWFEVSSLADGKLLVTVDELWYGSSARAATISITAGNAEPKTVTVTQSASALQSLTINPSSLSFASGETGSKSVTVTTNAPDGWKASYSANWFKVSSSSDSRLVVTVSELWYGSSAREATISITAGNAEPKTLTVRQSASTFGFSDIKNGTYTATGTPSVLTTPGARSWTGSIRANASGQYYELTNFGNDGVTVRLKFSQGKIYIDGAYKTGEYNSYEGYLRVAIKKDTYLYYGMSTHQYEVDYDRTTRTLDFSGIASFITNSGSVSGEALVGVMGFHESTGDLSITNFFTDMYKDLKLKLTFSGLRTDEPEPASVPAPTMKSAKGLIPYRAQ
jgi:hypothetical protein